jgi:predicted dehydrogenase
MRCLIVGVGVQGRKRRAVAGADVVATVDPVAPDANYKTLEEVLVERYDAALVCTPDSAKYAALSYLLARGKHILVEKPLILDDPAQFDELKASAQKTGAACYTAYNHRFEPHIRTLKELLDAGTIGPVYLARFFYGNGTARDVQRSAWRDQGAGVLTDLGSHLLDLTLFVFGKVNGPFVPWGSYRFENRAYDHCAFGVQPTTRSFSRDALAERIADASRLNGPVLEYQTSLISWRNTFSIDVIGEKGSAHVNGLCKWGPSTLTVRQRVLPSGRPEEQVKTVSGPDPTWELEYAHFKQLCRTGGTNLDNDRWIGAVLIDLASRSCATAVTGGSGEAKVA